MKFLNRVKKLATLVLVVSFLGVSKRLAAAAFGP